MFKVISWYEFKVPLKPIRLYSIFKRALNKCEDLLGTIYIAKEGVNINLSGYDKSIKYFLSLLVEIGFNINSCKFTQSKTNPFTTKKVLIKKEITALKDEGVLSFIDNINIDKDSYLKKNIGFLNADEWDLLLSKDDSIIIDVRNEYEHNIGCFTSNNTLLLKLNCFRSFNAWFDNHKHALYKYKNIGLYCTGGVRCEKISFSLIEKNINNKLFVLDGGIINYIQNCKNHNRYWKGDCYTFDGRNKISCKDIRG